MKTIQLNMNPDNWDESYMTVTGITMDDGWSLLASITQMPVKDMPADKLAVWHAAVEQFRTLGNGDWIAADVLVTKIEGCTTQWTPDPDSPPVDVTYPTKLICEVDARRDNGSMKSLQIPLEDAAMIAFFDYFTSTEAWITTHLTDQP